MACTDQVHAIWECTNLVHDEYGDGVDLLFANAQLAKICNSARLLRERWGVDGGRAVGRGLHLLHAAPDLDAVRSIPACRAPADADAAWAMAVRASALITFAPRIEAGGARSRSIVPIGADELLIIDVTATKPREWPDE